MQLVRGINQLCWGLGDQLLNIQSVESSFLVALSRFPFSSIFLLSRGVCFDFKAFFRDWMAVYFFFQFLFKKFERKAVFGNVRELFCNRLTRLFFF